MGEFVKKTLMGYKEVPDGQSDPECTHVILTETEYAKLQENIMLRPYFRANFKAGYWEAVFFHTKPLGVVPADMRAR